MQKSMPTQETGRSESSKGEETTMISCGESWDISMALELHTTLRHALEAQQPVVIDAAQVERVDTAVLQTLYAFVQDAQARGLEVRWQQPSQALCDATRLLDLGAVFLGLPTA